MTPRREHLIDPDDLPDRRPLSLTPAPPGWRAVIVRESEWWAVPVIGWELTENVRSDRNGVVTEDTPEGWRSREWRIRGAAGDDLMVDLEDYYNLGLWMLLAPGQPDPTDEELAERRAHVHKLQEWRRQQHDQAEERAVECRLLGLDPRVSDAVLDAARRREQREAEPRPPVSKAGPVAARAALATALVPSSDEAATVEAPLPLGRDDVRPPLGQRGQDPGA